MLQNSRAAALAVLIAVALGRPEPARTAPTDPAAAFGALQSFADQTLRASDAGLDTLARRFQPVQIPFVADALARRPDALRDADYEAMVRWHLWLNGTLDPDNGGLWTVDSTSPGGGVSAPVAALELVQLHALAVMARQRGYVFDALVWWKERHSLERRLSQRLYDPLRGAYADLDSSGALLPWRGPEALVPLALGAPTVLSASAQACRGWLSGGDPTLPAASQRLRAAQTLDPLQGWALLPGLDLWDVETSLSLLRSAVARGAQGELGRLIDDALADLGHEASSTIPVRFGARAFQVDLPQARLEPLARTATALDFLIDVGFLPEAQAQPLREARAALGPGGPEPATLQDLLGSTLGRWRTYDLTTQQYELLESTERATLAPNGAGRAAAFRFDSTRTDTWVREALRLLTQDFIDLHLRTVPAASYRAELTPHALPRGTRPDLKIHLKTASDREAALGETWNAAWTDGQVVDTPFALQLSSISEQELAGQVPAPPAELGIWWLILESPLRSPVTAPGVAVVEPFEARLQVEGPDPAGSARIHVRVASRVAHPLRGRVEGLLPLDWRAEPLPEPDFALRAGEAREWTFTLAPVDAVGPGRYRMSWNFYAGESLVSRLEEDLVVPFRWLRIGPFAAPAHEPLQPQHEPDTVVDLGGRYRGRGGTVGWQHLPDGSQLGGGWVAASLDAHDEPSVWYTVTAFSSSSDLVHVELESRGPSLVKLNGEVVVQCDRYKSHDSGDVSLQRGTNYVMVKCAGTAAQASRFRLDLTEIDGGPLHAVNNQLEHLMEGIAYVRGPGDSADDVPAGPPRLVPITYRNPAAREVAVVGTFNSWSPTASPMVKTSDGLWRAEIRLSPGQFEYKLAVDGGRWTADPANPRWTSDGFGGRSSILVVE